MKTSVFSRVAFNDRSIAAARHKSTSLKALIRSDMMIGMMSLVTAVALNFSPVAPAAASTLDFRFFFNFEA